MKNLVCRALWWLDHHSHMTRFGMIPPRWLCLAADVCYGWGPDATDWESDANWFHRLLYRWLW